MIRKKLTLLIIIAFLGISINAQEKEKFKIIRENQTSKHEFGINKYSFIHHLCPDSFFMTELYHDLDYEEMTLILKNIYNGVTSKEKVRVLYEQVKPTTAKIAYWVKDDTEKGKMFIMLTNFNNATRMFDEKPDPNDQLARWYFIRKDKLIYRKDLYSPELEKIKLKSEDKHDIIKYYLFDDNSDNDHLIKPLIDELLSSSKNILSKYFAQIYLVQYYLMNNQIDSAEIALMKLDFYFNTNSNELPYKKIYLQMVSAEYEVMKRM